MHPQHPNVTIRAAAAHDCRALAALDVYCPPRPWSAEEFERHCAHQGALAAVAQMGDGTIAGFACGRLVLDECEIYKIAVTPARRRNGVGVLLMEFMIREARGGGAHRVYLEVGRSNAPAIALYERCGFSVAYVRKSYYEGSGEDALVMALGGGDGPPQR